MGLFEKLKSGLRNTKNSLAEKLGGIFKASVKIDEDFFEELEETLITADIGAETSVEICDKLREQVKEQGIADSSEVLASMKAIIAEMISGDNSLSLDAKPAVITMIGVNGAGKTTTVGKLSANLKKEGKKVLVAAADVFRAAAIDQLNVWTDRAGVDIIKREEGSDPAAVVYDACSKVLADDYDVLIIDTAGRLHNKKNLMDELKKIDRIIGQKLPDSSRETLLVLDATTGQNAVNQAKLFNEAAEISGIVLTKLDGTAKGGIIIPIRNELNIPVKLVGVGEKLEDLQPFIPEDYAEALFGDINLYSDNEEEQQPIPENTEQPAPEADYQQAAPAESYSPENTEAAGLTDIADTIGTAYTKDTADITDNKNTAYTTDNTNTAHTTDNTNTADTTDNTNAADTADNTDTTDPIGAPPSPQPEKKKHWWSRNK